MNYLIQTQWMRENYTLQTYPLLIGHNPSQLDKRIYLIAEDWFPSFKDLYQITEQIRKLIIKYRENSDTELEPPIKKIKLVCDGSPTTFAKYQVSLSGSCTWHDMEVYYKQNFDRNLVVELYGQRFSWSVKHHTVKTLPDFISHIAFSKSLLGEEGLSWSFIDELERIATENNLHLI